MQESLTPTQQKVAEFIIQYIANTGFPPTLREISAAFGWSAVGTAQDVVIALRKKGVLKTENNGKARQIIPSSEAFNAFSLAADSSANMVLAPLLGEIQAGNPKEAIEHAEKMIPFPYTVSKAQKKINPFFSLVIEGYSMLYAGFIPGDYVLVEQTTAVNNGNIVVAAIDNSQVTVKRYAKRGSVIFSKASSTLSNLSPDIPSLLIPENPEFNPIPFGNKEEHKIIGLVRALYRNNV